MIARHITSGLAAPLMLAGCLAAPPVQTPALRDASVPLAVISRGGAQAMQGTWQVRASSPGYAGVQTVTFDTAAATQSVTFLQAGCDADGGCEAVADTWRAQPVAQNRWRLSAESADAELWVIWIDDGYRTAAIGSPDSNMAFILDRKAKGGADRITAAREVLDFNGYDMAAFLMR